MAVIKPKACWQSLEITAYLIGNSCAELLPVSSSDSNTPERSLAPNGERTTTRNNFLTHR